MDPNSQQSNSNNGQAQNGAQPPSPVNPQGFNSSQDVLLNNQTQDNTFQVPKQSATPAQTYQPPTERASSFGQSSKRDLPIFMQDNSPPQSPSTPPQQAPQPITSPPVQQVPQQEPQSAPNVQRPVNNQFAGQNQNLPTNPNPNMQQPIMSPTPVAMGARAPRSKNKRSTIKILLLVVLFLAVSGLLSWGAVKLVGFFNKSDDQETTKVVKDLSSEANGVSPPSSVFIRLKKLPADQTSEEFFNKYQSEFSKGFDEFTLINSRLITVDGLEAKSVEAEIIQSGQKQKAFFYLIFDGENGFTVTQAATVEQLIDVSDDFKMMIDNFDSTIGQPNS